MLVLFIRGNPCTGRYFSPAYNYVRKTVLILFVVYCTGCPVGYRLPAASPVCPAYRTPGKMKDVLPVARYYNFFSLNDPTPANTPPNGISLCQSSRLPVYVLQGSVFRLSVFLCLSVCLAETQNTGERRREKIHPCTYVELY